MNLDYNTTCPCGSDIEYSSCCALAHKKVELVITAEQLMRSRYTAFTLAMGDYLMKSHYRSTRPLSQKKSIVKWAKSVEWKGLQIIAKTKGLATDTKGTVEFKAFYFENGKLEFIHENSAFIKEKGCWYYLGYA